MGKPNGTKSSNSNCLNIRNWMICLIPEAAQTLLGGDDIASYATYTPDKAYITILDNDGIGKSNNRNTDVQSTGLTDDVISNGTIDVGLHEGQVTFALPIRPFGYAPSYFGDDNLQPIITLETESPPACRGRDVDSRFGDRETDVRQRRRR